METVLVTGGLGYIGSHTCVSLLENGYNLLIIDSLINSSPNTLENIIKTVSFKKIDIKDKIKFIKGDLRNKLLLDNIFNSYLESDNPIRSVIHFAGLKAICDSIKAPIEYWDFNITSTISLLSIMQKYQCYSLIFSGSASVYESKGMKLLKESDAIKPISPYGKTKLCIEEILGDLYAAEDNWRIASLRYFNPIGSHNLGFLPENPKGKTSSNLFPSIIRTALGNQKKFLIFGKDWPTYDGTCVRDFIHVMDLAEAHIAALIYLQENNSQNIAINIGTAKGTSVLELIKIFQEINKISIPFDFAERRMGDQPFLVADNKLALQLLDWFPKRDIFEMCSNSINKNIKII